MLRLQKIFPQLQKGPTLIITEQVMSIMTIEVAENPDQETAWGLAGFRSPDGMTAIITNVLRPDNSEVLRQHVRTSLGGQNQAEALMWLSENEKLIRKQLGIASDMTYGFLFKGHSHHQLGYDQYSSTDHASLLESVEKDGLVVAIGPLANIRKYEQDIKPRTGSPGLHVHIQEDIDFTFYWLSRAMLDKGERAPIKVQPTVISASDVFMPVPELGWHFLDRADYNEQLRHLTAYGCKVNVTARDVFTGPPLELQFVVSRAPYWKGTLSIVIKSDYPRTEPSFEVLAPRGPSSVAFIWANNPEKLDGPLWVPGEDLWESITRIEARGLL